MRRLGGVLGASSGVLGESWGRLGVSRKHLRPSCWRLGMSWRLLEFNFLATWSQIDAVQLGRQLRWIFG